MGTQHGRAYHDALLLKPSAAWHTGGESAKLHHDPWQYGAVDPSPHACGRHRGRTRAAGQRRAGASLVVPWCRPFCPRCRWCPSQDQRASLSSSETNRA
jgi:hypothetical protein